jgi:hypothetical protein
MNNQEKFSKLFDVLNEYYITPKSLDITLTPLISRIYEIFEDGEQSMDEREGRRKNAH